MSQRITNVRLCCCGIGPRLEEDVLNGLLGQLPPELINVYHRYHRWQDRQLYLFGRLLLKQGMKDLGYGEDVLRMISYNAYRKPYFQTLPVSFSISHSANLVAVALGVGVEVGLDVERQEGINIGEFRSVFPPNEWRYMHRQPDVLCCFYDFWTMKEAAIKAYGTGWCLTPTEVCISRQGVLVEEREWLTRPLPYFLGYSACLATSRPIGALPELLTFDFGAPAPAQRVSNNDFLTSNSLIVSEPYFDTAS